jgi:eukaryotic-like serine/threonine-protein kinase
MDRLAVNFQGTDRFRLLRVLGHGGMGVVYEALDQVRGTRVALKVLPLVSPEYLLRFKREFRSASGIHHPNLVKLGELVRFGEHWFFTMELVQGVDLLEFARGADPAPVPSGPRTLAWSSDDPEDEPPEGADDDAGRPPLAAADEAKIRTCLRQLAAALCALHESGCVHRDIKPSNVLVTAEGRVVLLDFGLASAAAFESTLFLAGTPLYMAPEQALSAPVTPAADWYGFGVLLFELLTGTLPFKGQVYEVLSAKQGGRAPPVRSFASGIPDDLAELCDALLATHPADRPSGAEVLARLGQAPHAHSGAVPGRPPERSLLVGREAEWARLHELFAEVRAGGHGLAVVLSGESGVGKSALARAFLDAHAKRDDLVTFFSRCYERELVPYKAVDGLLDSVAHYLRRAPETDVERILPSRAGVIAQVFPVLARVPALSRSTLPDVALDRREVRAWLFSAIRELFANIGQERPVIALVDDLHWADNDSMTLLSELLREPDSPRMLLLCTLRTQGSAERDKLFGEDVDERVLPLANLSADAAQSLALQLAARREGSLDSARVAAESGGHPLFLRELVEVALTEPSGGGITLDEVFGRRVAQLGENARELLALLSASGAPLESGVLREAAQIDGDALSAALHELRSAHLVHTAGELFDDRLDISHDRLRRTLRANLGAEQVEDLHLRLARALEARGEPVLSASHWREAHEPERAARHYASAGQLALDALAFGDAASHYRAALSLGSWSDGERTRLLAALGDALSNAGMGADAARQYRSAAELAPPSEALQLKRSAAEELVRSGYLDEGLGVAREVLSEAELTPSRAPLYALLAQRTLLKLRGLSFREREPDKLPARTLARIDLCWSMSTGLVLTDTFQGAYFIARGLALSLRSGDPYRIARSLGAEAAYKASQGPRGRARSEQLLASAEDLAERVRDPRATGTVLLMRGISAHLLGDFARALALLHRASATFREQCTGMFWERDAARQFWLECLFYMGDLASLRSAVLAGAREASERGAIYTATNLRCGLANAVWLADDAADEAEAQLQEAIKRWSTHGFHVQHWYALIAEVHIALYRGNGQQALALLTQRWQELERSHLLRVHHTRVVALHLRARAALCAACESTGRRRAELLQQARHDAQLLRRRSGQAAWALRLAELIELGCIRCEGGSVADEHVAELARRLRDIDLGIYAQALGLVSGGPVEALEQIGVRAPPRFARMLAPGWP